MCKLFDMCMRAPRKSNKVLNRDLRHPDKAPLIRAASERAKTQRKYCSHSKNARFPARSSAKGKFERERHVARESHRVVPPSGRVSISAKALCFVHAATVL